MIEGMEATPTTLDTYIDREHHHAAGTIANAIDDVPYNAALLAMRRLHYEGWRRRHQHSDRCHAQGGNQVNGVCQKVMP